MNEEDIIKLIQQDEWMMNILKTVKKLNLPDWWVGAGFIRSKIWDYLHNYKIRTPIPDIDVIYFDKSDFSKDEAEQETTSAEIKYENLLKKMMLDVNWSVTNQARAHVFHEHEPYKSAVEGLSYWVEIATCVGVKIDKNDKLILAAPRGVDDLVNLIVRPTPNSYKDTKKFEERIAKKGWLTKWPKLKVVLN